MKQTIGQIAYEAFTASVRKRNGYAVPWGDLPWQADFEAAAHAVAEHCANIGEDVSDEQLDDGEARAAMGVVNEIRALIGESHGAYQKEDQAPEA